MNKKISIILSGGVGARLWPISRRLHPKPFIKVAEKTLFQHTFERASAISDEVIVVTNKDHYFFTEKIIKETPVNANVSYLLEPVGRNTAPAISLAVNNIQEIYGDDAICLVLAADHHINDSIGFQKSVFQAFEQAVKGHLVVFGVRPKSPETGYGYLEVYENSKEPQKIIRFIEKPELNDAEHYFMDGRFYWNSGMFCFSAGVMAANLSIHAKDVWKETKNVYSNKIVNNEVTNFDGELFANIPDTSIDYAVMEKANNIVMIPADFDWTDLGDWDAIAKVHDADKNFNSSAGYDNQYFIETTNIHAECVSNTKKTIATIGINNLIIIDSTDALLIADRDKTQQVKSVVNSLRETDNFELINTPSKVQRPWGTYETLIKEDGYQVKRITVFQGQKLSLQYHHKRSEHWVITQGIAIVQVDNEEFETHAGEYKFIPLGTKHRLTNIGEEELILVEVQIGNYLGEDDIVRIEDSYGRA